MCYKGFVNGVMHPRILILGLGLGLGMGLARFLLKEIRIPSHRKSKLKPSKPNQ